MRKLYLFAAFLVIYEFTTYIANDMIMPGMLHVVKEFHAPIRYVSLSLSLYLLGNMSLQLFLGPLADKFGKRKVILTGNMFFLIFTIFIMSAQNIHQFMLGRLLQGSGLSVIALGYTLIHEKFDDKSSVKIFAIMANVSLLAPLIGPLVGVVVMQAFGWRHIFILIAILAIITLSGLYKFIPKEVPKKANLEISSIVSNYISILKMPQITVGIICTGFMALPILYWIALTPTILMHVERLSMIHYAVCQLFAIGGLSISAITMQFIAGKYSFYRLIVAACFLSFIGLGVGLVFHYDLKLIVFGMFLYSFGLGIANSLLVRIIMTVPGVSKNMLTSLMVFIQTVMFAVGIELTSHISEKFGYSLYSFTIIGFVTACIFFIMTNIYAYHNRRRKWK